MLVYLISLAAGSCPKTQCGIYSSHMCALFSTDSIRLSPCLDGDFCDITKLHSSWEEGNTGLECHSSHFESDKNSVFELMDEICKVSPNKAKKLVESHPKRCLNNNDCLLNDGSHAECRCGLSINGFGYCEVSEGDDDYAKMIDSACRKEIDNFVYLVMKVKFFVFLHDRPVCAGFVSEDLAAIDYLYAGGSLIQIDESESSGEWINFVILGMLFV